MTSKRLFSSHVEPIAVNMPSASINHSDNDPSAFHYESIDGMPVSKFPFPEGHTVDDILAQYAHIDPFAIVAKDLSSFSDSVTQVVHSEHPLMEQVARYVLDAKGKRFRPTVVLLMSRALGTPANPLPVSDANVNGHNAHADSIDTPLTPGLAPLSSSSASNPFASILSYVSPNTIGKQSDTNYSEIEPT